MFVPRTKRLQSFDILFLELFECDCFRRKIYLFSSPISKSKFEDRRNHVVRSPAHEFRKQNQTRPTVQCQMKTWTHADLMRTWDEPLTWLSISLLNVCNLHRKSCYADSLTVYWKRLWVLDIARITFMSFQIRISWRPYEEENVHNISINNRDYRPGIWWRDFTFDNPNLLRFLKKIILSSLSEVAE